MKKLLMMLGVLALISCEKAEMMEKEIVQEMVDNTPTVEMPSMVDGFSTMGKQIVYQGAFTTASHTTSGMATVVKDSQDKYTLLITNLKSDPGPDLRIYLSNDKVASDFIEIADKVKNGDTAIEIPTTWKSASQKNVLIWCKQFRVLFGSAEVK